MLDQIGRGRQSANIGLLGPSFETSNRGVSALTEGSIKCILNRWSGAKITLLGGGRVECEYRLKVFGRELRLKALPIRFCKNVFLPNHFCVLLLYAFLLKLVPWKRFENALAAHKPYLKEILEMDMVADVTGGDSFSDIYGMRSFVLGFLRKWLVMMFGKKLVMLPQTYGPFNRQITKILAKYTLSRTMLVYSRDRVGADSVRNLLGLRMENGKVEYAPDVAFILDARKPKTLSIEPSVDMHRNGSILVGLNISGLLFNGGFTRDNMFGLKTDYRELIESVVHLLIEQMGVLVLLIPHVFSPPSDVESDVDACLKTYDTLQEKFKGRLFLTQGEYDQNEIKYIIGICDFFIGSRMHACIAALSQCVPTVAIAYSKKFHGVFESVDMENCVADARTMGKEEIGEKIRLMFQKRDKIQRCLERTVPNVKYNVLNIFDALSANDFFEQRI